MEEKITEKNPMGGDMPKISWGKWKPQGDAIDRLVLTDEEKYKTLVGLYHKANETEPPKPILAMDIAEAISLATVKKVVAEIGKNVGEITHSEEGRPVVGYLLGRDFWQALKATVEKEG